MMHSLDSLLPNTEFADVQISGLCDDSRKVKQGDLFFACSGEHVDGTQFIDDAIDKKAAAIIVEKSERWSESVQHRDVPVVVVENLTTAMAQVAKTFYGDVSQQLALLGITGTNAKTSCSSYIQQVLNALDLSCASIGTLGWGMSQDNLNFTGNTTPNSLLLNQILFQLKQQNAQYCALEVSSHGLELGRVEGLQFAVAVLSNISRDHLDFHETMENYVAAKQQLFQAESLQLAVINADDIYAQQFIDVVDPSVEIITYGFSQHARLRISQFQSSFAGMSASIHYQNKSYQLNSHLLGDFNIYNLSAVLACLIGLKIDVETAVQALSKVEPVKGRMEKVDHSSSVIVVVDYAHTPDGLEKVLETLSKHKSDANLWCVFGCGGDRDKGKRPLMGHAVKEWADKAVVTSDNPRSENPQSIIDDVLNFEGSNQDWCHQELDREQAIQFAIEQAEDGDCVLIAGKGHEDYQIIGDEKIAFDDYQIAMHALNQREGIAV